MIKVKARFDGRVFIPEDPVNLPIGQVLEIHFTPAPNGKEPTALQKLAAALRQLPDDPDAPTDLAAQHDHYLYGTPKRP